MKIKLCKIKTIYGEEFIAKCTYYTICNCSYIDTDKGRIDKCEIEDFEIIGEI